MLAVQYGMEAEGLALRIGQPPIVARDLLRAHRDMYRTFWRWSDAAVDTAMLTGSLQPCSVGTCTSARTPIRDRCEISRCRPTAPKCCGLPACLATERGRRGLRPDP